MVEADQVRKGKYGVLWGVVYPHPRRKGFWVCASNEFPYDVIVAGRRELEAMPLLDDPKGYFTGPHPGVKYWNDFANMKVRRG
jgi:hypothetical protein